MLLPSSIPPYVSATTSPVVLERFPPSGSTTLSSRLDLKNLLAPLAGPELNSGLPLRQEARPNGDSSDPTTEGEKLAPFCDRCGSEAVPTCARPMANRKRVATAALTDQEPYTSYD